MRLTFVAVLALCATTAFADRLMFMPTATKIRFREARTELILDRSATRDYRAYLGLGLTPEFELEFLLDRIAPHAGVGSFNFSYNYVPAISDVAPGVSIGVRDALNRTPEGRLVYLASTYRMGVAGEYTANVPLELTLGVGVGRRRQGVFTGVMIPFTYQFRMLAEFDLDQVTGGLEYRPMPAASLRLMFRERQTLIGVRYSLRF